MFRLLSSWLSRKWTATPDLNLANDYHSTFATVAGQRVLKHMMDSVYCQIYHGKDPIEAATHNGRRSFVHEILENIDMAENPDKYKVSVQQEELNVSRR